MTSPAAPTKRAPVAPAASTITVTIAGQEHDLPVGQAEFDTFRLRGGRAASTWNATKQAAVAFGSLASAAEISIWVIAEDQPGLAFLARFDRKGRGDAFTPSYVCAARILT